MEKLSKNSKENRKANAPETANTGRTESLTGIITAFFTNFSDFALTLDKLSLSTKLILLILGLSIFLPISVGVMVYLIFLGITLILKGG